MENKLKLISYYLHGQLFIVMSMNKAWNCNFAPQHHSLPTKHITKQL